MDSAVRPRPNHYQTLGLSPGASGEEIAEAFAREVSMFRARPFGGLAQVSVAYETLRDPARRRAYDAALGLASEPEPRPAPPGPRNGAALIGSAPRTPLEEPPERRLGSFIAESLREPATADETRPRPDGAAEAQRPADAEPGFRPDLAELLAGHHAEKRPALAWRRPAMAAGALVLAVGLAGALLAWQGGEVTPSQSAAPDLTVALPPAEASPSIESASTPELSATQAPATAPVAESVVASAEPAPEPEKPAVTKDEPAIQMVRVEPAESAAEGSGGTTAAAAAATVEASLPLPNATVARTIERIGYACGGIASATAVEGAAGVFKVTCTSGDSYRAAPVNGRYRFRRWERR